MFKQNIPYLKKLEIRAEWKSAALQNRKENNYSTATEPICLFEPAVVFTFIFSYGGRISEVYFWRFYIPTAFLKCRSRTLREIFV